MLVFNGVEGDQWYWTVVMEVVFVVIQIGGPTLAVGVLGYVWICLRRWRDRGYEDEYGKRLK